MIISSYYDHNLMYDHLIISCSSSPPKLNYPHVKGGAWQANQEHPLQHDRGGRQCGFLFFSFHLIIYSSVYYWGCRQCGRIQDVHGGKVRGVGWIIIIIIIVLSINDIFPPWWDFVMWGICWKAMMMMMMIVVVMMMIRWPTWAQWW